MAWARLVIAEPRRSWGRNCIIEMKPVSSGPTRSAPETRTSLEGELGGVGLVLADLVEHAPTLKPSRVVSTANSEMPLAFFSGLVRAATRTRSAEPPLVMKVFDPLMIQVVAVAHGGGLEFRQVRAAAGSVMPIA